MHPQPAGEANRQTTDLRLAWKESLHLFDHAPMTTQIPAIGAPEYPAGNTLITGT
jgi:hypothetical protein